MSGTTAKDGKGMTLAEYNQSLGLVCGRNPHHASGGAFKTESIFTITFLFYAMMGGNPFLLVLMGSSPIVEHNPSKKMTEADAALEALLTRGLVRPGMGKPTVIHHIGGLFGCNVIHFVQVDEEALASKGRHSFFGFNKVYTLLDPITGLTQGGKRYSSGLTLAQYAAILDALLPKLSSASPPSLAGVARGGGGAVAGGGGGGAAATSLPTVPCGHDVCSTMEHLENAGHGVILFPWFMYHDRASGATFPVVILVHEKGSWNAICERMNHSDKGCWYSTITRALREEGKMKLRKSLKQSDGTPVRGSLGRTPVWYLQIGDLVETTLNRATLNARVTSDNADPKLPKDFKEIQAIGFFRQLPDGSLVGLTGNPSVRFDVFSRIVNSLLKDLVQALPK